MKTLSKFGFYPAGKITRLKFQKDRYEDTRHMSLVDYHHDDVSV